MKNVPATFQRLIGRVTASLNNVVLYIDDVLVHNNTCQVPGPIFRPLCREREVLPRGVKFKAILDLPTPRYRCEVMQLLGMCGFYRLFFPNFAAVAEQPTNPIRKGLNFCWSSEAERAVFKTFFPVNQ